MFWVEVKVPSDKMASLGATNAIRLLRLEEEPRPTLKVRILHIPNFFFLSNSFLLTENFAKCKLSPASLPAAFFLR